MKMIECDGCGEFFPEDEMEQVEGDFVEGWYCDCCYESLSNNLDDEDSD